MRAMLRAASVAFTGGALGGLLTAVAATLVPATGVVLALGSHYALPLHPRFLFDPPTLYRFMVWGGLFAAWFLLPAARRLVWWRWGLSVGLLAALAKLFIAYPLNYGAAMLAGAALGPGTVPWVIVFHLLYGFTAAYYVHLAAGIGRPR